MKIYNPKSKRHVDASGPTAKKLYKEHLKGMIQLDDGDVSILEKLYSSSKTSSLTSTHHGPNTSQINNFATSKNNSLIVRFKDFQNVQKINTQGTSNIFTGFLGNEKYYIKEVVKNAQANQRTNAYGVYDVELAMNEVLASVLYTDVYNVDAIKLVLVVNDSSRSHQRYMVGSKAIMIDTCEPITKDCENLIKNKITGAIEPFLVDCILSNWDVGSRGNVGIIVTEDGKKKAFRIDVGGALLYRALGQPRQYTNTPNEHQTFFNPSNKGYKLFSSLKKKQVSAMLESIERVGIDAFQTVRDRMTLILNESNIHKEDLKRAINVLHVLETVKARHMFYTDNTKSIKSFLLEKIKSRQ
jgi:hypothetical protein